MALQVFKPDATVENADWAKRGTWDLPPYRMARFNELGFDRDNFKKSQAYIGAVERGLIVDDKWVGPVSDEDWMYELTSLLSDLVDARRRRGHAR